MSIGPRSLDMADILAVAARVPSGSLPAHDAQDNSAVRCPGASCNNSAFGRGLLFAPAASFVYSDTHGCFLLHAVAGVSHAPCLSVAASCFPGGRLGQRGPDDHRQTIR